MRKGIPEDLAAVGDNLLKNLSLLFVPAGVGVMVYGALFAREAVAIVAALIGSTVITIGITALIMQRLNKAPVLMETPKTDLRK